MYLLQNLIYFLLGSINPSRGPRITIKQGTLVGTVMESQNGSKFYSFQGIPYAAAPVGKLRFQNPTKPPRWTGDFMAVKEGNECIQKNVVFPWITGAEDCLYLNVYTPSVHENNNLPVMVWIHGGGFSQGSGGAFLYGPQFLLNHQVVLVTFNYRLGMLGFLNMGTPEISGNYGLKDQVAVLKWVQENIRYFGGNPKLVTIFGESAGAASVHYLLVSPLAKGLFSKAIVQSGSAFNDWANLKQPRRVSLRAVRNVGCKSKIEIENINCLRETDATKFVREGVALEKLERRIAGFAPSKEHKNAEIPFLNKDPEQLPVADVPIMAGMTTHEGMVLFWNKRPLRIKDEMGKNKDYYMPKKLKLVKDSVEFYQVWTEVMKFYKNLSRDYFERYIMLASDVHFGIGVDQMITSLVTNERKSPLYLYQFSYDGSRGINKLLTRIKRPGACHGDELGYLFNHKVLNIFKPISKQDLRTINIMTTMWTNFAKIGNPTPTNNLKAQWLPLQVGAPTQILEIGKELIMRNQSFDARRMQFWSWLMKKIP
ncbi:esterase FE4-like [Neocloeon triangulifer]|uniref:esterase FE4-like n=1 Tax=Neocloeon triangulifer TaxID=2078957 RepID=UPI00286EF5C2|nr:esterase FE4-like [Neocloeon triangulifer]